jgi:hypothetical protein
MGRACSMNGAKINHIGYSRESKKERDHWEDLYVYKSIILKLILE